MATITYTFVDRCQGGGHTRLDISVNNGASQRVVYDTDDLPKPLSDLGPAQQDILKLYVLKIHMQGKTRAEMHAEFQAGPITVTV